MEKLKPNRVNLDFEYELYDSNYHPDKKKFKKINQEMEWIYFYSNESSPLYSAMEYEQSYLDFIKDLGFITNLSLVSKGPYRNWWGSLDQIEFEKEINSKLSSFQLRDSFETEIIVESKDEVLNHIVKYPAIQQWFLKSPYELSGKGFKSITSDHAESLAFNSKYILEPYYNRVLDVGVTINQDIERCFFNINDQRGQFKGIIDFKDDKKLRDFLENEQAGLAEYYFSTFLPKLKDCTQKIKDHYQIDKFQYDNFISYDGKNFHSHCLIEINHRKTMASFFSMVEHLIADTSVVSLMIEKNTDKQGARKVSDHHYILSPKTSMFEVSLKGED